MTVLLSMQECVFSLCNETTRVLRRLSVYHLSHLVCVVWEMFCVRLKIAEGDGGFGEMFGCVGVCQMITVSYWKPSVFGSRLIVMPSNEKVTVWTLSQNVIGWGVVRWSTGVFLLCGKLVLNSDACCLMRVSFQFEHVCLCHSKVPVHIQKPTHSVLVLICQTWFCLKQFF